MIVTFEGSDLEWEEDPVEEKRRWRLDMARDPAADRYLPKTAPDFKEGKWNAKGSEETSGVIVDANVRLCKLKADRLEAIRAPRPDRLAARKEYEAAKARIHMQKSRPGGRWPVLGQKMVMLYDEGRSSPILTSRETPFHLLRLGTADCSHSAVVALRQSTIRWPTLKWIPPNLIGESQPERTISSSSASSSCERFSLLRTTLGYPSGVLPHGLRRKPEDCTERPPHQLEERVRMERPQGLRRNPGDCTERL
ncbi:GD17710 [Drosophila simulans]|uniref:GD17710 n=1 Tax=Drosophila simulans TaxID=7240 RepID=B4NSU0_DROSI|nr:GD17710 [Drosophila simulans]